MPIRHGIYVTEEDTKFTTPILADNAIVCIGAAPIYGKKNISGLINTPILCNSAQEAMDILGYSDDWAAFPACEMMYITANLFPVAPVVYIIPDDLDGVYTGANQSITPGANAPRSHTIQAAYAMHDYIKVSYTSNSETTYLQEDVDYTVDIEADQFTVTFIEKGSDPQPWTLADKIEWAVMPVSRINSDAVVAGEYDSTTGKASGAELIPFIYPKLGVVPSILVAPGKTSATVGAALSAKAANLNGVFKAIAVLDIESSTCKTYTAVRAAKATLGLAELVDAPVLLAGDIDRGGVFAQLYGTVMLLDKRERARVRGLVINKFRGDEALLRPGLRQLESLTGVPVLGVVPFLPVRIDDEDSLAPCLAERTARKPIDIAVIRLPHIANFTDFSPLQAHPLLGVRYVADAKNLGTPDLLILPGTKNTIDDLLWLRESGLESAVLHLAAAGTPVFGICGGYQMLGGMITDTAGLEGSCPSLPGMGLLPCETAFEAGKTLTRVRAAVTGGPFDGAALEGYEIHMGATAVRGEPFCRLEDGRAEGCRSGNVFGSYLHGLFDSGELTEKLADWLCGRRGMEKKNAAAEPWRESRERQYDLLAAGVREALDMDAIYRMMEEYA